MTQPHRIEPITLVDTPDLIVIQGLNSAAQGVPVVVFASANRDARSGRMLEYVGPLSTLDRPIYWISETEARWFATPGVVDRIVEVIRAEMARWGATEVDTLGSSMGGFGALVFAERLPVRTAVSIASRFTPDDRIVPDRRLREKLRPWLDRFPFRTVTAGLAAARHAVVLHGDEGPDRPHILKFTLPATAEHWILPECGHFVGRCLRERGVVTQVFSGAMTRNWPAMRAALKSARARPAAAARPAIRRGLLLDWVRQA